MNNSTKRFVGGLLAAALLSASAVGLGTPAAATPADPGVTQPEETLTTIVVEEILMDKHGNVKSRDSKVAFQEAAEQSSSAALAAPSSAALMASGSEGTSSANGCKTATVRNVERSTLGTLLYTYKTSTSWCWIRSSSFIYQVSNDWDYINDDLCWSWQGEVNKDTNFYNWSGGPQSGYLHRRKGHVQGGCVFPNNKYPENYIRAHSNGTWTWDTNG